MKTINWTALCSCKVHREAMGCHICTDTATCPLSIFPFLYSLLPSLHSSLSCSLPFFLSAFHCSLFCLHVVLFSVTLAFGFWLCKALCDGAFGKQLPRALWSLSAWQQILELGLLRAWKMRYSNPMFFGWTVEPQGTVELMPEPHFKGSYMRRKVTNFSSKSKDKLNRDTMNSPQCWELLTKGCDAVALFFSALWQ